MKNKLFFSLLHNIIYNINQPFSQWAAEEIKQSLESKNNRDNVIYIYDIIFTL